MNYMIKSINKDKLEQFGFKCDNSYNVLYNNSVCDDQMSIVIPGTFRHKYMLYVGTGTVLEGIIYYIRGAEAYDPEEFLNLMKFKAPEAAENTRKLINDLIESKAIVLEN